MLGIQGREFFAVVSILAAIYIYKKMLDLAIGGQHEHSHAQTVEIILELIAGG